MGSYIRIDDEHKLARYFDGMVDGIKTIFKKGGEHGASPTVLASLVVSLARNKSGYVLVHVDDSDNVEGFLLALAMPNEISPWIEVIALWTRPRVATRLQTEVNAKLDEWARSIGAKRIVSTVTRSPRTFFKWFYQPLGYKVIGYVMEKELS